jgi:ribosome recycling factor
MLFVRAEIKRAFEDNELSEDEKFRLEEKLQELTNELMEKIEKIGKAKEKELLTV